MPLQEPSQLNHHCRVCGSTKSLLIYMFYGEPAYICSRCKDEGTFELLEDEEIQAGFVSTDLDGFLER